MNRSVKIKSRFFFWSCYSGFCRQVFAHFLPVVGRVASRPQVVRGEIVTVTPAAARTSNLGRTGYNSREFSTMTLIQCSAGFSRSLLFKLLVGPEQMTLRCAACHEGWMDKL